MGTSTPGSWPQPKGGLDDQARRGRRAVTVAVSVVGSVALIGALVWSIISPGEYTTSRDGCVAVSMASSTGAVDLRQCGPGALALCRSVVGDSGTLALRIRRQCELAGIG